MEGEKKIIMIRGVRNLIKLQWLIILKFGHLLCLRRSIVEKILVICGNKEHRNKFMRTITQRGAGKFNVISYAKTEDVDGELKRNQEPVPLVILCLKKGDDAVWEFWRVRYRLPNAEVIVQLNPYNPGKALMLIRLGSYDVFESVDELWGIVKRVIGPKAPSAKRSTKLFNILKKLQNVIVQIFFGLPKDAQRGGRRKRWPKLLMNKR